MKAEFLDLTQTWAGIVSLFIFIAAYLLVVFEEKIHLRKSKPVLLASGLIWVVIAIYSFKSELNLDVHAALKHNLLEYSELFFFLLVAMTYINAMMERGVFDSLRVWLVSKKLFIQDPFLDHRGDRVFSFANC